MRLSYYTERFSDMDKAISATEAVRDFSGLLNMVKFKGETYIIKRGGVHPSPIWGQ